MATAVPASTTAGNEVRPGAKRSTVSAVFGNYIEYVDFGSYGFMAAIIGANFFPGDASAQLLSSLAVFGVTFFFRPFGGFLWGYIGDRHGRKNALVWAIALMSLSTALIGVLPNYAAIGIAAPVLLVVLRSIQGISIGGEFAGAGTFIAETAPSNRRGVWSSYISVSAALGTLTASTLVLTLTLTLTSEQMSSWGWRIPFLLALPIGVVALIMRAKAEETEVFVKMREKEKAPNNPFKGFGKEEVKNIFIVAVFASAAGLGIYYFFTYFNIYLSTTVGLSSSTAIGLTAVGLILYSVMCPFAGLIGDLWGRKRPFVISLIGLGLVAVPVFMLLGTGIAAAIVGLIIFGLAQSVVNVSTSVVLAEMFRARSRMSGGAIGHNIGLALVGGTGPLVAAALVSLTGNPLAPGFYLGAVALLAGVITWVVLPETGKRSMFADESASVKAQELELDGSTTSARA
jgi:MHS family proline/betaine transporter-like MFS transporter